MNDKIGYYEIIKRFGLRLVTYELFRRIFRRKYRYKECLIINSTQIFRELCKSVIKYNISLSCIDNKTIIIDTVVGKLKFYNNSGIDIFGTITDLYEIQLKYYNAVPIDKNSVVVDVGAFIGDSVLLFHKKGAAKIIAYEPVPEYFQILVDNIRLNNVSDFVEARNYGLWFEDKKIPMNIIGQSSQVWLHDESKDEKGTKQFVVVRNIINEFRSLAESTSKFNHKIMKMDCEGCEYCLLVMPNELIKIFDIYIVEIHGNENPILWKMIKNNYEARKIVDLKKAEEKVSIWFFRKTS